MMYSNDYFYTLIDELGFDVAYAMNRNEISKTERSVFMAFGKGREKILVEKKHGEDVILMDNRKDTSKSLEEYKMKFIGVLERFYLHDAIYEKVSNLGAWVKEKVPGYHLNDPELSGYWSDEYEGNPRLKEFMSKTEGKVFTSPKIMQDLFRF